MNAAETPRHHKGNVSSSERLLAAAIAAFALFVLGVKLLPNRAIEPAAASRGSPSPTVQPSAIEVSTASSTRGTVRDLGPMLMGPQIVSVGGVELTFEVPSPGWEQFGDLYIAKSFTTDNEPDALIYWTPIEGDIAGPCSALVGPATGLTIEDQAVALRGADGLDWGYVEPSGKGSIGGLPAGYLDVRVGEAAGCGHGYYFDWQQVDGGLAWAGPRTGDEIRVWVVDVNGRRIIVQAVMRAEAVEAAGPDLDQIVGSIRFP